MKSIKVLSYFIILFLLDQNTLGSEVDKTISFYFDNDTFIGTDRSFTGGYRLNWVVSELKRFKNSSWLKWIPLNKSVEAKHLLSFSVGQNVYTPDDIGQAELIKDDRPYAGYLYVSAAFSSTFYRTRESFEISLGIVGPHAYAEEAQSFVHRITGSKKAQGWQNQLKDEPILQVFYEKSKKIRVAELARNFRIEIIPSLGAGLGNAIISGNLGLFSRLGWHILDDFGLPIKRPSGLKGAMIGKKVPMGVYVFASVNTFLNIRNIFLDGNTLAESHSVDKHLFSGDFSVGLAIQVKGFHISYTYTLWTKRFVGESRAHRYGSLSIAYTY